VDRTYIAYRTAIISVLFKPRTSWHLQPDDGDNGDNRPKQFPHKTKSIARYPKEADQGHGGQQDSPLKEFLLKESPLLESHLKDPRHFAFKEAGIESLSYSVVQSEKKERYIRPQIN
jgi:hypothetical protein